MVRRLVPQSKRGFGSHLIERLFAGQIRGSELMPTGVVHPAGARR